MAFRLLEYAFYLLCRGFFRRHYGTQSLPDAEHLLGNIPDIAPGEYGIHTGAFQILMLPAKRVDGCVPGKDVGPEAFQLRVHAVAPCLLSAARSRFWRSVSSAVSFS